MVDQERERYWIKPGIMVQRLDGTGPVMTVLRLERVSKKLPNGDRKTYLKGVSCYWIDAMGQKQIGRFHTAELKQWKP